MEQSKHRTQAILSWHRTEQLDLRVEQDELRRYLILNGQQQSQMVLKHPTQPCYPHLVLVGLVIREALAAFFASWIRSR